MEVVEDVLDHKVDLIFVLGVKLLLIAAEDVIKEVDAGLSKLPTFLTLLKELKQSPQWEKRLAL